MLEAEFSGWATKEKVIYVLEMTRGLSWRDWSAVLCRDIVVIAMIVAIWIFRSGDRQDTARCVPTCWFVV